MEVAEHSDVPFPWMTIDDAFPPELVRAAGSEWSIVPPDAWHVYQGGKRATKHRSNVPPACAELIRRMSSLPVTGTLGCQSVFPDLTLHGAGLHEIASHGSLAAHLDSDHHPLLGWTREISGVLFLNEEWPASWGGHLELLNATNGEAEKWISPQFNRLVLFRCLGESWHRVSQVMCPNEQSRKTLALFWWSLRPIAQQRPTAQFLLPAESVADKQP